MAKEVLEEDQMEFGEKRLYDWQHERKAQGKQICNSPLIIKGGQIIISALF